MRTLEINSEERSITFGGQTARARWTKEVTEDLAEYHGVNIVPEIAKALLQELDHEFNLTEEEKEYCLAKLLVEFKQ